MRSFAASALPGFPPAEVRSLGYLLLVVIIARLGFDSVPRGVPFFEILSTFGSDYQWMQLLNLAFISGTIVAVLPLGGRYLPLGCLLAGGSVLLKVLGNMGMYSNARLFHGLLLLLIGLCYSSRGVSFLRLQCILIYAGATLSKCLDPDWWNGRYMQVMFQFHLPPALAETLAPLAAVAGIASIATEAATGVLLSIPSTRNYGVCLVVAFHTLLLLLLNEDFATFYYSVALSATLLFLRLPQIVRISAPFAVLAGWSVFADVRRAPGASGPFRVQFENTCLTGFSAISFLLLANLPLLAVLLGSAAYCSRNHDFAIRNIIVAILVFTGFALPMAAWWNRERTAA